ncbi:MAG: aminotransferase class III-fold pyridoxal phosphate-dependent enzyme [Desulfovibrio sp.]|jgi:taurine--2-oxoglutarate transaminase|nr:aminotransferase class III-fold pyridoxal phosphate-dependent enzyme [Desulfovibrio sp.]
MSEASVKANHSTYNLQSWSKQRGLNPIVVEKAEGIYLWDPSGKRYSDMSSQLVNMNLGHGNRAIIEAIKKQADVYCFIAPSYGSEARGELAKLLISLLPDNFGKIFFTNGGADANENAIKMARMFTGKQKIFSRYRSYHGSTFGAGNLTGEPRRYPLEPGVPGFVKFFDPYIYREKISFASEKEASNYYTAKLREQIIYENPDNVAAIVLETVTGSNGVIIPPVGYLAGVRSVCDEFGIMLICDEVMAGFGRTGKMFAFEHYGVKPDIVVFAKGVTCGYVQLGGVAVSRAIAAHFDDYFLSCGLTYSGHPLACAAGLACVNYYKEHNILDNVNARGKELAAIFSSLKEKHACVGDARCIGLFGAIELVKNKKTREPLTQYGKDPDGVMKKIIGELAARGFMTYSHENMFLVAPPLIISGEQLAEEMRKVDEVLAVVDKQIA